VEQATAAVMSEPDPGPWPMWAHDRRGQYQNPGDKWWVELHGLTDPVVPVTVTEVAGDDPAGTHWGWLESESAAAVYNRAPDDRPRMIWASRTAFDVQFTYGPDAEVEAGKGRVVRLRITRRDE
jgi:hypothetical protein